MEKEQQARRGIWLGMLSSFYWFFPLFGFIFSISAIVQSLQGLNSRAHLQAKCGLFLGVLCLIITFINCFVPLLDIMDVSFSGNISCNKGYIKS